MLYTSGLLIVIFLLIYILLSQRETSSINKMKKSANQSLEKIEKFRKTSIK